MTLSIKHKFNSALVDGADTSLVRPSNWNDEHNLLLATKKLVGRYAATDGPAQEITLGDGLALDTTTGKLDTSNVGALSYFAMAAPPTGWLKANGALLSRATYANLFAAIGTLYGVGDGTSTFALPDLRGYFLRAWDDGRGIDAARAIGTAQADLAGPHTHPLSDPGHAHSIADPGHAHGVGDPGHSHTYLAPRGGSYGNDNSGSGIQTENTGASGIGIWIGGAGTGIGIYGAGTGITIAANSGAETRPKNYAALVCIKY